MRDGIRAVASACEALIWRFLGLTLAAMLMALPAPQAMAQSLDYSGSPATKDEPADKWTFTLGAGAGIAPEFEGSEDYDAVPIPLARIGRGPVFGQLFGTHITSNLIDHPNWRLGPSLNFRQGYSDVSDKRVDNLTNRGSSYEVGVKGGYEFNFSGGEGGFMPEDSSIDLEVEFLHDVTSGHEGWVLTPAVAYGMPLGDSWNIGTGAEFAVASGNYMSHYFSVNSREAANSRLDNYDADGDIKHVAFNFGATYRFLDNWGLNMVAQYKLMTGDADDSPVVDDQGSSHQGFFGALISYTW